MIPPEQVAEIKRLYHGEHWKTGSIASALGIHPDTVRRVIGTERFNESKPPRPSVIDPFIPFLRETLERYPRVVGTRLFDMVKARGYTGTLHPLWRVLQGLRPRRASKAYLRMSVLPGEYAQADWGHFGTVRIGKGLRPVSCFVMVLSYSRAIHAYFTLDQTLESFLRGHLSAFALFGGVPRVILYDNLKSAVLERRGEAIHFHPRLLDLAGHYRFEPRPCNVGAANEKGRVERAIGYLRTSFFAARPFRDTDDLNRQYPVWRDTVAHVRRVPGDPQVTVAEALEHERRFLQGLPANAFETDLLRTVVPDKTAHVRFDRNAYSTPPPLIGKPVTLVVSEKVVRIVDGDSEAARHARSYGTAEVISDDAHIAAIVATKQGGAVLRGRDRLRAAVPETDTLFELLALRGDNLGRNTVRLLRLLDRYGEKELSSAVREALARGVVGAAAVEHLIERGRREKAEPPSVPVELPDHLKAKDVRITPHRLEDYDALGNNDPKPNP